MKNRIKELREKHGLSQQQLADRIGTSNQQIGMLERGARRLSDVWIEKLAGAFNVRPSELIEEQLIKGNIPVVGYVGAGSEVHAIDDHAQGTGFDEIEALPGLAGDAVAVIIRGDSMWPVLREGDILIYDHRVEGDYSRLIGEECVIGLADDRVFVKELARGSAPGLWTLISHNDAPIYDIPIAWVAKVKFIKRR